MSAAMSPPHPAPQRARAFINHSPESYSEAIGARAASRGSPRQAQAQAQAQASTGNNNSNSNSNKNDSGSQPETRVPSPLQFASSQLGSQPELNVKFETPAESSSQTGSPRRRRSSAASTASSTAAADATAVNTPSLAPTAVVHDGNNATGAGAGAGAFSSPFDARARRSDTMPAHLLAQLPERPQSRSAVPPAYEHQHEHQHQRQHQHRSFSSSSGSESGSSQHSENEKRVKEFKDAPRKRRRTSPNELHILETEFARNNKPCKEERERIAATMGMDEKAVQVWFQNKRQSCRRQQSGGSSSSNGSSAPGSGGSGGSSGGSGSGSAALRTQSLPMLGTSPTFQDENAVHMFARAPLPPPPFTSKPAFAVQTQGAAQPAKRAKSLRLAMSADGKAELVERSPLKTLHQNGPAAAPAMQFPQFAPMPHLAMRFASTPLSGMETECATSLLFLKSGHWP